MEKTRINRDGSVPPGPGAGGPKEVEVKVAAFWQRYAEVLGRERVPEAKRVWYQRACERFIRHLSPRRLREATAGEVSEYLCLLAAQTGAQFEKMVRALRFLHYSYRTEQTYVGWAERFVEFSGVGSTVSLNAAEVRRFLENLAVRLRVAASTQNQALNALVFLYREVLHLELGAIGGLVRAKRPQRV
jgi:hypothetical protein